LGCEYVCVYKLLTVRRGFLFFSRAHGACFFVTVILDLPRLVHEFIRGYSLQAWLIGGKQRRVHNVCVVLAS